MKFTSYFLITLFLFGCNSRTEKSESSEIKKPTESEQKIKQDTILVVDSIADNPFLFETWKVPIDSILVHFPVDAKIDIESKKSTFYSPKLDSVYTITYGNSKLIYVKNPKMGFVEKVIIKDDFLKLKRNIKIGTDFKKIISLIDEIESQEIMADVIEIAWGEATSYLYLEFDDNRLIKITYCPYVG